MKKLSLRISADKTEWSDEFNKHVFDVLAKNPFFSEWEILTVGSGSLKEKKFDHKKVLDILLSSKKEICFNVYGKETGFHVNEFCINRTKHYYNFWLQLERKHLGNEDSIRQFQEYMLNLALETPKFKRLSSSTGSEVYDIQKKYNIEEEKSIFISMPWLSVLSPLAYDTYYEKKDLLNAPFYRVEEIMPDIVLIQAYKNPFDIENEESLDYLRKGVEYLNKHIVFLKGKE